MPDPSSRRRLTKFALAAAAAAVAVPLAAGRLVAQAPAPTPPLPPLPAGAAGVPGAGPPPAAPAPATRPSPDTVVVTVGDEKVTQAEFDQFIGALHPSDQQMARGPYRRPWAESLANMKLLAREAQKRKLEQDPAVQKQLALMRDQVLANAMVAAVQQSGDDAYLKKYYDEHKQQLERVSARHVLIRTPGSQVPLRPGQKELTEPEAKAKADAVAAKLKAGADFAAVAKAESDDEGSAADGGDLGSFTRGKMVPEFEQAVFSQKENEIGSPIKTKFGYHVIQVTGRYDTFEKLADVLRQQLAPQRTNQLVADLKKQTKVELNDAVLGPPVPMDAGEGGPPGQP